MQRLILLLVFLGGLAHASPPLLLQRQSFLLAERAIARTEGVELAALLSPLQGYPLLPYLQQQELMGRLDTASAAEVRDFLSAHGDTPPGRALRRDWLSRLAKEQRWGDFFADYRQDEANTELECYHRQGLLVQGQSQAALDDMQRFWLSPRSQPEACDPLFARWREQGGLNSSLIWQRIALAMDEGNSGLTGYLGGLLPSAERVWVERWRQAHSNPASILQAESFNSAHPYREAILLHGLRRWSRQNSPAAANAMDALKARYSFDPAKLGPIEAQIATFLAARGHPDAARRLAAVPPVAADEAVQEWRVRVPLRQQQWSAVQQALTTMDPTLANTPRWTYWRARTAAALGQADTATALYRQAAQQRDYYGFLAAAHLGVAPTMTHQPIAPDPALQAALMARPAVQRTQELFILGRETEARREWRELLAGLSNEERLQAALLAHDWGWHFQAIVTLVQADHWHDLGVRFPLVHRPQVLAAAERQALDPAWVLAVIRQESLFQPAARSPAGARGLMQIMPATGRLIAQELGESFPGNTGLMDPNTSIRFGSYYLRRNLGRLQNNPLLASAAYNAGRGRVLEWLPTSPMAADIWAETIPFQETRGYVQRVLEYTLVYQARLGQNPVSVLELIGTIQPANS